MIGNAPALSHGTLAKIWKIGQRLLFGIGLLASSPSYAQDLGGALNNILSPGSNANGGSSQAASPQAASQPTASPVGLVQTASPGLAVQNFQQVYAGQSIPLGASGTVAISYFSTCAIESATGGTLTIGTLGGSDAGGNMSSAAQPCAPQSVATNAGNSEAGAAVERLSPFQPSQWAETTVSTFEPRFEAEGLDAGTHVRVLMLDAPEPTIVWEGTLKRARYSKKLPRLEQGRPYRVEVTSDGQTRSAVFSVDPGYLTASGDPADTVRLGD